MPSELRLYAPAPVARAIGKTPMMKANDVIRIGRSRCRDGALADSRMLIPCFSHDLDAELDDQDRVLGLQADQHDQADLPEDVQRHVVEPEADDRAERGQGHRQDDDQRAGSSSRRGPP